MIRSHLHQFRILHITMMTPVFPENIPLKVWAFVESINSGISVRDKPLNLRKQVMPVKMAIPAVSFGWISIYMVLPRSRVHSVCRDGIREGIASKRGANSTHKVLIILNSLKERRVARKDTTAQGEVLIIVFYAQLGILLPLGGNH